MRYVLGVAVALLVCGVAVADDWPGWLGPSRNGVSTESGWSTSWPADGPPVAWKRNVGRGHSAVAVVGRRVYTMGNADGKDTVFCLDAKTGEKIWTHSYPCKPGKYPGSHSTPTVDGPRVYTYSREGLLLCLTADKGDVVWSRNLKAEFKSKGPRWDFACSPLVVGGKIIVEVGAKDAAVVALAKADGKVLWTVGNETPAHSSPVSVKLGGKSCALVFTATALLCVDIADGTQLWRYPWKNNPPNVSATPIVIGGDRVFISSHYGGGCAMLKMAADKVTVLWRNRNMANHFANCVVLGGYIYGLHGQHAGKAPLRCLDAATGKVKWSRRTAGGAAVRLVDGKLVMLTGEGVLKIAAASPEGLTQLAAAKVLAKTCWTAPVLANGRIYCRNNRGDLVCLNVTPTPPPAAPTGRK